MSARTLIGVSIILSLVAAGCGKEPLPKGVHGPDEHGHDHDHDHDHHDHDHDHADLKRFELGKAKIGAAEITATQLGLVAPGKEAMIEIKPTAPLAAGATVRAWIGAESAAAADKTVAIFNAAHGDYDGHVKVPMPLQSGAKWWIEVEPAGGPAATSSFALKP